MMHGLEGSSADFVLNWPRKAPAFLIVDKGYDLWLGNNRGNAYSKGHSKLRLPEEAHLYWDYTIEELGTHDLKSMINKVLEENRGTKIETFIGYELGNTQFFAAASLDPQWFQDKVNLFVALAPFTENHRQIWFGLVLYEWFINIFRWFE